MSLIEIKLPVDSVERIVRAVESIASTLREYCFSAKPPISSKTRGEECLTEFDPEQEALREEEEDARDILAKSRQR